MSLDRQNLTSFQSLRRIGLSVLSIFILIKLAFSLIGTLDRPQIQGKFELYQTNLVLVAGEWKPTNDSAGLGTLQQSIIGTDFLKSATQQYQTARESDLETISKLRDSLSDLVTPATDLTNSTKAISAGIEVQTKLLNQTISAVKIEIDKIDLRIGILQAAADKSAQAIETWQKVITSGNKSTAQNTAASLIDIWQQPSGVNTNTAPQITANIRSSFDGWFRDQALKQLYLDLDDRVELAQLDLTVQSRAKSAVIKLTLNTIPRLLIGLGGLGLIIFFVIRFVIKLVQQRGERSFSAILLENIQTPWSTPWNWEVVWQVFTIGFFFVGQFLLPVIFSRFINPATLTARGQGIYVFSSYLLMSGLSIGVLYLSIKDYFPLPTDWFQFNWKSNWLLWGIGGYLVATPIVIVVSIFNEKIWAGQGGNNPLLQIVLESKDQVGLWLFFLTAAVAAPLFEEFLFRGFLLPSLTRYVPTWGAIGISGLLFGVAHLSLSEIIPLTTLGIVLGIVYVRTRNLLAPMLLHSLWNSSTLVSLFILGSSN
jgi:uncharacterized protein